MRLARREPRWSAERRAVSAETAPCSGEHGQVDGAPVGAPPPFFLGEARRGFLQWRGKTRMQRRIARTGSLCLASPRRGGGVDRRRTVEGASRDASFVVGAERCDADAGTPAPSGEAPSPQPSPRTRGEGVRLDLPERRGFNPGQIKRAENTPNAAREEHEHDLSHCRCAADHAPPARRREERRSRGAHHRARGRRGRRLRLLSGELSGTVAHAGGLRSDRGAGGSRGQARRACGVRHARADRCQGRHRL